MRCALLHLRDTAAPDTAALQHTTRAWAAGGPALGQQRRARAATVAGLQPPDVVARRLHDGMLRQHLRTCCQ